MVAQKIGNEFSWDPSPYKKHHHKQKHIQVIDMTPKKEHDSNTPPKTETSPR